MGYSCVGQPGRCRAGCSAAERANTNQVIYNTRLTIQIVLKQLYSIKRDLNPQLCDNNQPVMVTPCPSYTP